MSERRPSDESTLDGPRCCAALRTKMLYVAGGPADWSRPSTTAQYWCLETMSAVGPDDAQATPASCRAGRACFSDDP